MLQPASAAAFARIETAMPQKLKSKTEQTGDKVDTLCKDCGKTFSEFLQKMEEQNAKVVCPSCGKEQHPTAASSMKRHSSLKRH